MCFINRNQVLSSSAISSFSTFDLLYCRSGGKGEEDAAARVLLANIEGFQIGRGQGTLYLNI
jgi:hypothetical protein